jgi:hypothetical protein
LTLTTVMIIAFGLTMLGAQSASAAVPANDNFADATTVTEPLRSPTRIQLDPIRRNAGLALDLVPEPDAPDPPFPRSVVNDDAENEPQASSTSRRSFRAWTPTRVFGERSSSGSAAGI